MHIQPLKIALTGLLFAVTALADWEVLYYSSLDCTGQIKSSASGSEGTAGCEGVVVDIHSASISGDGAWDVSLYNSGSCDGSPDGGGQTPEVDGCIWAGDGETWGSLKVTSAG